MSIFLLAVVLVGFAQTFYLRPLFKVPAIPWYVYVHGSVMTAWIVLFVIQTSLIAAHRSDVHRRLGAFGALLALAVTGLGIFLTVKIPANFKGTGGLSAIRGPTLPLPIAMQIFWGNIGALTLFPVYVAIALWMRRRPEVHKRLLLLASIAMVGPALGRIAGFPQQWGAAPSSFIVIAFQFLNVALALGLPLTLVVHDLLTARKLSRATAWAAFSSAAIGIGTVLVIPATGAGRAVWRALQ
ncbi:MAG TPA: hypothetical protein VIY90_07045 [Steroidobacteraceae bacterium]